MALTTLLFKRTEVHVLVIRQSETYGGVFEGSLSSRMNERVIQRAKEKADYLWPEIPVFCLEPESMDEEMPKVMCHSLLEYVSPDDEASRLILLHFEDDFRDHFSAKTRDRLGVKEWPVRPTTSMH